MVPEYSLLEPDLPFALQVEITSHCNLTCRMCPLTSGGTSSSVTIGHVKPELWREIVPMARAAGQVIISGFGEPLVNPMCIPLLKELDRAGVRISLTTNGTTITRSTAAELTAIRHLVHINVSIDSPDPAVYRGIRGGDVAKALNGLQNLMTSIDDPDRVTVSSVVMASNIVTLSRFPPILARLGVRRYVLQGLTDYNEASGAGRVSAISDGRRQFQLLLAACRQAGVEPVAHPHCLETEVGDDGPAWARSERSEAVEQTRLCSLPWEIPFIDKDGGVYPCCYAASQSAGRLGELQRETLADIWSGPRYQQFRGDLLDGRTTPGICRQCTKVPLGEHLLRRYAARLLPGQSILRGTTTLRLAVQNVGSRAWTSADRVRIGTANPRDHGSAYATAGWLSANRVTSFDEHRVDPGATATFQFSIQSAATLAFDTFQLVVDGQCWMPNTRFKVSAHES